MQPPFLTFPQMPPRSDAKRVHATFTPADFAAVAAAAKRASKTVTAFVHDAALSAAASGAPVVVREIADQVPAVIVALRQIGTDLRAIADRTVRSGRLAGWDADAARARVEKMETVFRAALGLPPW